MKFFCCTKRPLGKKPNYRLLFKAPLLLVQTTLVVVAPILLIYWFWVPSFKRSFTIFSPTQWNASLHGIDILVSNSLYWVDYHNMVVQIRSIRFQGQYCKCLRMDFHVLTILLHILDLVTIMWLCTNKQWTFGTQLLDLEGWNLFIQYLNNSLKLEFLGLNAMIVHLHKKALKTSLSSIRFKFLSFLWTQ
jgi:hypothetical protein